MVFQIGVEYYIWFQWRCKFWINVNHLLDHGNEASTMSCGHEKDLIHHV
jgi:hypothetical protein